MRLAAIAIVVLICGCGGEPTATEPSPIAQKSGPLGDTWTWDGTTWHRAATTGPSPRYYPALAYDGGRKQFVMFGGQTAKGQSDETWIWESSKWRMVTPAHKPPPRNNAAMAYDPTSHLVVLYGGLVPDSAEGHEVGDTWTWNGTDWTQVGQGPGPPLARRGAMLLAASDRLLMFGGNVFNAVYYGDVWSWDGRAWSPADTAPRPPGRGNAAVAWDSKASSLLVYGGSGLNPTSGPGALGSPLSDGWSLTAGKWSKLEGAGPGKLAFGNAVWDSAGGRFIVLLGMQCPNPSAAAWGWDGKAWRQLKDPGIPARWGAALTQRPEGSALLFGGSNEKGC